MKPENETFAGCCFLGFFGHILHINENILQLPLVIVPNQKHLKFVKKKIIIEEKKSEPLKYWCLNCYCDRLYLI